MSLTVLFQNEHLIAVDKPSGMFVHPPQDGRRVSRDRVCMYVLRDQIGQYLYPVHRLDVATSGVLLFALSKENARGLCDLFMHQQIKKKYWAVARGWVPESGEIDLPLPNDLESAYDYPARTLFTKRAQIQIDEPVGKKFPYARYSLIDVEPQTGRFHQIRRHFARKSHPLVGDGDHGDSHHNRFFRNKLGISGLCLRAHEIQFVTPIGGENLQISAGLDEKWQKIETMFATV